MRRTLLPFVVVMLLLLSGCATTPLETLVVDHTYGYYGEGALAGRYAPIIAPQHPEKSYNHIGHAAARLDELGAEEIYINTDQPVFYYQEQDFSTARGNSYHNLIYRVHFTEVPESHLTYGKNGGLFVVITLNSRQQPVLVTTVHSCGCYLAMLPTSYLDTAAYPDDWDVDSQLVFGEALLGRLDYPAEFNTNFRPRIVLRDGNHRVLDISVVKHDQYKEQSHWVDLLPTAALEHLPLGKGQTSFFYQSGANKGYVKGASKLWERLLMSWWTFDWRVGQDKRLGDPAETGVVFYTSLAPWARDESNMWFFADFLEYWGWRL